MIQAKRAYVKVRILALVVAGYWVWVLAKGLIDIRLAYERIDEARGMLLSEQKENEDLKVKLAEVQTDEYLEEVARNELNMQKDGETVVVLGEGIRQKEEGIRRKVEEKEVANWRKWWKLIR